MHQTLVIMIMVAAAVAAVIIIGVGMTGLGDVFSDLLAAALVVCLVVIGTALCRLLIMP